MNSDNTTTNNQCDEVAQATQRIRDVFRSSRNVKTEELLNHFWDLQDCLHRLVNTLADDKTLLSHMDQKYPRLLSDAKDVLSFSSKTLVGAIPAVSYSCRAIQGLLLEIQNLRHSIPLATSAQILVEE